MAFKDTGKTWPAPSCLESDWVVRAPLQASRFIRVGLTRGLEPPRSEREGHQLYWRLVTRAFDVLDTLPTWEIPLLLGEGRVRYGLRWADLADIASSEAGMVQRSPQALHKRFGPTVNRLARAAETMSRGADDDDFYTAAGLLA